ncbi:hypothetical protein CENSYa_0111 [Cenarchaeum symbiosum A]|uniref:Uncharacterized protein n=1 Tax=Cenarchaeum symbiosum (strain A) TaxID=414004 RepID=A0RTT9_CENSY|nr:hypothetical protein CENSYa_0111 [Cenarchaeum symbiosum A]
MVKQISLDSWQVQHLVRLLRRGSADVNRTGTPILLYRQTLEEEEDCYEETICTLVVDHVIEQRVTSGGPVPPTFNEQLVYTIDEYPARLIRISRDRLQEIIALLESRFGQP